MNREPPRAFLCPITQDVMKDPVLAPDGYSYEREAIEQWLVASRTSPMTREAMPSGSLVLNRALRDAIEEWQCDTAEQSVAATRDQLPMEPTGKPESRLANVEVHPPPSAPPLDVSLQESVTEKAERLCREGIWMRELGDNEGAEAAFREAARVVPRFAPAWFQLGTTLLIHTGDLAGGEAAFAKAIEADPTYAPAWRAVGILAGNTGDISKAVIAYNKAVGCDPSFAQAWYELGSILMRQKKDFNGAERAYRKAVEADPQCAKAWSDLGLILMEIKHDTAGAERALRKAIEADPMSSTAWCDLGMMLGAKREDWDGAEEAFRKALDADSTNESARTGLRQARELGQQRRTARAIVSMRQQAKREAKNECVVS
jgi:Tfp pilus assembly protein PilF